MARAERFAFIALGALLALASCKKDEPEPPAPQSGNNDSSGTTAPSTIPRFADADGVMAAVRAYTSQSTPFGTIDIILGTASAAFSNDGFATFVGVGGVSCNGEALSAQPNGTYAYAPSAANPTGIDFTASNEVTWTVAGGSSFPAFTRTLADPFPAVDAITSSATVVRADGYTLSTTAVSNADSVIFTLGGLVRVLPGSATSCSFTAAELAGQSPGTSIAQIVGYRYVDETIGGKRIYFVKQASRSQSITIQ